MKWNQKYLLGIPAVDAQHKQLFRLSDELDAALREGIRPEDLNALLIGLQQYATRHFSLEEKQMAAVDYPGLAEQQETHLQFAARFQEIYQQFTRDGLTAEITNLIEQELSSWIREHVTGIDQEFGTFHKRLK